MPILHANPNTPLAKSHLMPIVTQPINSSQIQTVKRLMQSRPFNAKPSHFPLLFCLLQHFNQICPSPKVSAPPYSSKNSNPQCKHQLAKVQVFSPRRSHVEPTHVEPKHPPDSLGFGRQYFAQPYWHVAIEDQLTCRLGADVYHADRWKEQQLA